METKSPEGNEESTPLSAEDLDGITGGCDCEFRSQTVTLKRNVDITNSPPPFTQKKTDECGNLIP